MNPLVERKARVTVSVARPGDTPDAESQTSTYEFIDHRMDIKVEQGGGNYGSAKVKIYGVSLDAMNNIARLWLEVLSPSNADTLAIDVWDGDTFVPLFTGVITWSAVNAQGAPQVALEIEANESMAALNTVAPPYAQDTPVSLEDALSTILADTGLTVEMAEGTPELQAQKVHLTGSAGDQVTNLMRYFPEVTWYVNLQRFIVRPVNGPLGGDPVTVSKDTGMVGYPTYSTSGITVSMLFDPRVRPGLTLDIQTVFDFVNRTKWVSSVLQHDLQPNFPGGQWLTHVAAQAYGSKGDTAGSTT